MLELSAIKGSKFCKEIYVMDTRIRHGIEFYVKKFKDESLREGKVNG